MIKLFFEFIKYWWEKDRDSCDGCGSKPAFSDGAYLLLCDDCDRITYPTVAQSVEHQTENLGVTGSIPVGGTNFHIWE